MTYLFRLRLNFVIIYLHLLSYQLLDLESHYNTLVSISFFLNTLNLRIIHLDTTQQREIIFHFLEEIKFPTRNDKFY